MAKSKRKAVKNKTTKKKRTNTQTKLKAKSKGKARAEVKAKVKAESRVKAKTKAKAPTSSKKSAPTTESAPAPSLLGQRVTDFTLQSTSGEPVSLSSLRGKKVVLYFYPKDATPGCTIEGHDFSKLLPEFEKENTLVFGVSRDSLPSHQKFKEQECFTFDLLSDEDETACKIFDVIKEKNMYGKKVIGIERSTFLLNPEGVVAGEWRKVSVEGHAQAVLEKTRSL
ncbi:MAG: hypothetical protein C5B49_04925 [Bdellovibrio sp.]|nr:MAG: hypothetical protein C5B49_04925 [Bdellovibrio sp.]